MLTVTVGVPIFLTFQENDQVGLPMKTPVVGTPGFSNSNPAVGVITPSPSGQSVTYNAQAPGTDSVTCVLTVSAQTFTGTTSITAIPATQVLTSISVVQIPALI